MQSHETYKTLTAFLEINSISWILMGIGAAAMGFVTGHFLALGKPIKKSHGFFELHPDSALEVRVGSYQSFSLVLLNPTSSLDISNLSAARDRYRDDWRTYLVAGDVPNSQYVEMVKEGGHAILYAIVTTNHNFISMRPRAT